MGYGNQRRQRTEVSESGASRGAQRSQRSAESVGTVGVTGVLHIDGDWQLNVPVTPHDWIDAGSLCGLPLEGVVDPNAAQSWWSACSPSDAAQGREGGVVDAVEG